MYRASFVLRALAAASALTALASAAGAQPPAADDSFRAAIEHQGAAATDPDHAGIWKAAMPFAGTMHGELGQNDPFALSVGVRVWADCSINWLDPDSGRRYCFSTATSLVMFLDAPHARLERARKNWPGS